MSDEQPTLTIIGGPNGSGKSTLTKGLVAATHVPIIDPDAIARNIRPSAPELAALEAGREAIRLQRLYLAEGLSFAVETTLAGNVTLHLMEEARQRGFSVTLFFIAVKNADLNIERVGNRVARGGHHVPSEDVRRRYARSMENLPRAIEIADHVTILDNSTKHEPRVVLTVEAGRITFQARRLPRWVTAALGALLAKDRLG